MADAHAAPWGSKIRLDLTDYLQILELSDELVCVAAMDGTILAANAGWTAVLGYSADEMIGYLPLHLVHPDDLDQARQLLRILRERPPGEVLRDVEIRCRHRDGSTRWLVWKLQNRPERELIYAVAHDITEARRTQAELRHQSQFLHNIVDHLPVALFVKNARADFVFSLWNRRCEELFGRAASEVLHRGDYELFPRAQADFFRATDREAFAAGKVITVLEEPVQTPLGERWVQSYKVAVTDEAGAPDYLIGISLDLTEAKAADRTIRESEAKLKRVLVDGRIATWETDLRTGATTFSTAALDWFGLPDEGPITGDQFMALIHPEDLPRIMTRMRSALEERSSYEIEFRIRSQGGGPYRWYFGTGDPVFDDDGQPARLVGITLDINERKQLEETVTQQREQMVATARLSAIGEMAGGVAHEINNPLAIIHILAGQLKDLARSQKLDPLAVERTTEKIELTVMRIAKIINSLRALSRGGDADPFEETSLRKVVDETLEFCQQRFKSRQVKLSIEGLEHDLKLMARPVQIAQVLLNLFSNALDAVSPATGSPSPTGLEPWVRLSVRDDGDRVELAVTDSGPRIAEELREKIFRPFFSTKASNLGTGLGLSVSRRIIESHGGTIGVDPESAQMRIVISLPKTH